MSSVPIGRTAMLVEHEWRWCVTCVLGGNLADHSLGHVHQSSQRYFGSHLLTAMDDLSKAWRFHSGNTRWTPTAPVSLRCALVSHCKKAWKMSSVMSIRVSQEEERKTSDVSGSLPKPPSLRTSSTGRMHVWPCPTERSWSLP